MVKCPLSEGELGASADVWGEYAEQLLSAAGLQRQPGRGGVTAAQPVIMHGP
jgi:hypothetical protein